MKDKWNNTGFIQEQPENLPEVSRVFLKCSGVFRVFSKL
jgi:hypothetical protein